MRVTILKTPCEPELDGVRLDNFLPGTTRDVSPSIGSWMVAQGYALPEMRLTRREGAPDGISEPAGGTLSDLFRSEK